MKTASNIQENAEDIYAELDNPPFPRSPVDGYAVQVDMSDFKALVSLLRNCANNLNQIAKRVNSTGNLYQEDIADLQERYRELWGAVSTLLGKLTDL